MSIAQITTRLQSVNDVLSSCAGGRLTFDDVSVLSEFLSFCGISKTYYEKHRTDICSQTATDENKKFRKSIDRAIEKDTDQAEYDMFCDRQRILLLSGQFA